MKGKGWIITVSHVDAPARYFLHEAKEDYPVPFKLYDDDKELYFEGRMTLKLYDSHRILDPLDATQEDYGCTGMMVKGPHETKWEWV